MLQGASALGVSHLEKELGLKPRTFAAMPEAEAAAGKKGLYPQVDRIMNDYAKSRSFWITGIVKEDILKQARNFVFQYAKEHPGWEALPDGEKVGFEEGLYKTLREFLPTRDKAGNLINVAARSEVVARTNMMDIYNLARYQTMNVPGLKGWVQAYRYSAIIDMATTTICRHLHGKIFTDQTLNGYVPPNHYNCRSMLLPVTRLDQNWEAEMRQQGPVDVKPASGFATPAGAPPVVPAGKVAIPGEQLPGEVPQKEPRAKAAPKPEMVNVKLEDLVTDVGRLPAEVGVALEQELARIGKKVPKEQVEAIRQQLGAKKVELVAAREARRIAREQEMVPWDLSKRIWLEAFPEEVRFRIKQEFPKGEIARGQVESVEKAAKAKAAVIQREVVAQRAEVARRAAEQAAIQAAQQAEIERAARIRQEAQARELERLPVGRFKAQNNIEGWAELPANIRKKAADWAWRQGELQAGAVANVKVRLQGMIEKWMRQEALPVPGPGAAPRAQGPALNQGVMKVRLDSMEFERQKVVGVRKKPWEKLKFERMNDGIRRRVNEWFDQEYPGGLVPVADMAAFKGRLAQQMKFIIKDRFNLDREYRNFEIKYQIPMDTAGRARAEEMLRQAEIERAARKERERIENAARMKREEAERIAREERRKVERAAQAERDRIANEEKAKLEALKEPSYQKAQIGSPPETMPVKSGDKLGAGGVNATYKIMLEDGSKWAFKPVKGEDYNMRSSMQNPSFTLGHREVLAKRMDEAIGTDLCPDVFFRRVTLNGKDLGWGSMMRWSENSTEAYQWSGAKMPQGHAYRFSVLDLVIGNTDRHGRNYMVKNSTSLPFAIDHGYSFPEASGSDPAGLRQLRAGASMELKAGDPMGEPWRKETAAKIRAIDVTKIRDAFPTMSSGEVIALINRLELVANALDNNTIRELIRKHYGGG
jgi:SPP1 gp7 family putative phage head morphogenesis protein